MEIKRIALFVCLVLGATTLFAQSKVSGELSGRVTDGNDKPLAEVNVIVDGGTKMTTTDRGGNYQLVLAPGVHDVSFSHIQYQDVRKKIQLTGGQQLSLGVRMDGRNYNLDDITVTGSAMPTTVSKLSSSVALIKANNPVMQQIQNPDDALNYIPGVYVRRLKGLATIPGHTQVQLRGTGAANRTMVLKDGVPINDPYTGGVLEWNTTATNSISRIEVVRGPGSALYGSGSMGGTINLVTEQPSEKTTLGVNFMQGSNNTTIAGAKAGKLFKNGFGVIGFAEYKRTDGYQYMANSLWKDYYKKPESELFNANLKLSYLTGAHSRLEAVIDYHQQKALTGTSTIYNSNYKMSNNLVRFEGGTDQSVNYSFTAYYNHQDRNTDAEKWNSDDSQFNTAYYESSVPVDVYGFIGKLNKTIANNSLTIGIDMKGTRVDSDKDQYSSGVQQFSGEQNFLSFFVNDDVTLWEKLNLNLGLRYDHWENNNGKFFDNTTGEDVSFSYDDESSNVLTPKVGLSYRVNDRLRLRTSYAMGFKAPNIYYMYNASVLGTSFRLGNPELKPERMTYSVDFGADWYLNDKLELSATYYQSSFKDFIDNVTIDASEVPSYFDPGDLPVQQYINIGKVDLKGVEAALTYNFLPHFKAIVSYFYNHSEVIRYESNTDYVGNELEDSPKMLVSGGINYENSKIFNAGLWIRHSGKYYSDMENSADLSVDPSTVVDLKLSKNIGHFQLSANVLNVFDQVYYGTFSSKTSYYYAPPRTVNLGAAYHF